jgi:periplasmic protein TonB
MKKLFIIFGLLISGISFAQTETKNPDDHIFTTPEQFPSFPGGEEKMMAFIKKNIRYPELERQAGISGTCYITFVVEKSGKIREAKILRGVPGGPGCDKEALRVINKMPKWKPGKQNGRKVRVQFNLPIKYTLK